MWRLMVGVRKMENKWVLKCKVYHLMEWGIQYKTGKGRSGVCVHVCTCRRMRFGKVWFTDTTERLPFHFSLSRIGEGNGSPLQCSCLENPRDGGACRLWGHTESDTTEATWQQQNRRESKPCRSLGWTLAWRTPGRRSMELILPFTCLWKQPGSSSPP